MFNLSDAFAGIQLLRLGVMLFITVFWPLTLFAQKSTKLTDDNQKQVDLHPLGFPAYDNPVASADVRAGLLFLSKDRLALYFEQPSSETANQSHSFTVLIFDGSGQLLAQQVFPANERLLDITSGPNETVFLRRSEKLDIYSARLQFIKSHLLPSTTLGTRFNRVSNQLVVVTETEDPGQQKAQFLDANSFEELTSFVYPKRSTAIFGEMQLAYSVGGYCKGALHFLPDYVGWQKLGPLQACNALTFVGKDALAYALSQELYVVDRNGKELFSGHIPAPDSFHMPSFVGLSDDGTRLAIMALMKKSIFSTKKVDTGPYFSEAFVYDVMTKRLLLRHPLSGGYAAALSPDGHSLATIESGILKLVPVP